MTKIWLKTEFKRAAGMLPMILKRAVVLLLIFGMAAGAAAFCVVMANGQSDDSRIRLGYAAPESKLTDMVVSYVQEIESVKALCSIERMSREDGLSLLREGALAAFVELPDNIVEEIISGTNAPATVYMADDGAVKNLLFRELADAAVGMLQTAQAEIYAVSYVLDEEVYADNALVQKIYDDINRFNLSVAADRENLFKPKAVSVTGNDTYVIYYGSAILVIYLLLVGMFFGDFFCHSVTWRNMLEKRLKTLRPWQTVCGFFAGLLPMLAVTLLPFAALILPIVRKHVSVGFSWSVVSLILMSAVFLVLYFMLIYQILGEKRSALLPIGILMTVQAYMSGCVVPSALLPDLIYGVGKYLPAAFLKQAFTIILSGDAQNFSSAMFGLLMWSIVLFAVNTVWGYIGVMHDEGKSNVSAPEGKKTIIPPVVWVVFKRMSLKKGILISLALMAAVSVLITCLEDKSDTTFIVAVFDESGAYEEVLGSHDSLVRFHICNSADEVEKLVLTNRAECGYILPKDLTDNMIAGRANRTVTVYEDSDSICVPLVNEVVFSAVFRHVSLEWYKDYVSAFHADLALTEEVFADQIALGKTFDIAFMTVGEDRVENAETGSARTYPVTIVVAIAVIICGVQGALAAAEDYRKGRFDKRSRGKIAVLTIVLPMITAAVFGAGMAICLKAL